MAEFDGIDLENLANSESSIVETGSISDPNTGKTVNKNTSQASEENDLQDNDEGIDINILAGDGDEGTEGNDDEDNDGDSSEKKNKEIKVPADDAATSSSQNTFTSLASALAEAGTLTTLTDEELAGITDAGSLLEALDKQVKDNEFAKLNDLQKQYMEALEAGVPHDTFVHTMASADAYAKISDEVIEGRADIQAELIRRSFLVKGFSAEKANSYAALAMKGDDPVKEAIESRNALVAFEKGRIDQEINAGKQSQEDQIKEAEKALANLKTKVTETSEVIPGIKVNSPTREKIFKSMTTPIKVKDEMPLNEVMDKYESDAEYKMRLHALHVLTNGFTDFSKFTKTIKSTAIKDLEDKVNSGGFPISGKPASKGVVASASQTDMAEALKHLKL